jgi:hypothetical protein
MADNPNDDEMGQEFDRAQGAQKAVEGILEPTIKSYENTLARLRAEMGLMPG